MLKTNEQDVVLAKNKIAELKSSYMNAVSQYIQSTKTSGNEEIIKNLLACQKTGNEYFNYAEEFVGNSDILGAHKSALWAQGFAEDCAEILKSLPIHIELLTKSFSRYMPNFDLSILAPGNTAYANMQRMIVKYLNIEEVNNLRSLLNKAELPIYGFRNEAKEFMSKKLQTILSFSFGTIFVSVLIIIAFILPNPSNFQQTVFRVVLALAGGGTVAVFPGFIEVKFGNWLRAGGALAVFAIVYFCSPAMIQNNNQGIEQQNSTIEQKAQQVNKPDRK
ncbi:MAG: hypothetical protein PHI97_30485 [Desulfobulbus sp.]|nr:hypothetical protein [Desulfobulbus sp.]